MLLIICLLCCAATNETYTVTIPAIDLKLTNVVSFTNCSPYCTGINYVSDGRTNTFHAFAVKFNVTTNAATK